MAIYDSQDYLSYYASSLASRPDKSKGNPEDQLSGVPKAIARLLEDQGKAYLALGNQEEAKKSLEKALSESPGYEPAQKALENLNK
jgi:Tfp pilus assembly protein PilF